MNKQMFILIVILFILDFVSAKNSTRVASSSKSSSSKNKEKNKDRLPSRKGSLTSDSIFEELLNGKAGPPRKKRVRTISQPIELSYPSVALPELSKFNFHPQKSAYQYSYLNNQRYPGSVFPIPYQRLSSSILKCSHLPTSRFYSY